MRGSDILRSVRTQPSKQPLINLLSSPLWVAVGATAAGEWLLYTGHTDFALWGHLFALFGCLFAPLIADADLAGVRAFVLVPLFRLVNLGMPVFVEVTLFWLPVVYGSLLPSIYVVATAADSPRIRWNVRRGAKLAIPSVLVGASLGYAEHLLLRPDALVVSLTPTDLLAVVIVMFGFVSLVEELVFRGFLQQTLVERVGRWPGLLATNLLFGAMHSTYPSPTAIGFVALLGLLFSLSYEATDSLLVPITIHGTANVFLFAILPLYEPLASL